MTRAQYLRKQAEWLRDQQVRLGLTLREIADGIGVSEGAVSTWIRANSIMSGLAEHKLKEFFRRAWREREREATEQAARAEAQQ